MGNPKIFLKEYIKLIKTMYSKGQNLCNDKWSNTTPIKVERGV